MWENAQTMLKAALDEMGVDYFEAEGGSSFYGPKLDIQVKTALVKEETLSTIQLDFLLPERFDLQYIGADGEEHRPVMIHRGLSPTMERFTAILIENYKVLPNLACTSPSNPLSQYLTKNTWTTLGK